MPKYIPGRPSIVVRLRGSGIVAANYAYRVAPRDGLTLVMLPRHVYIQQLVDRKEAWFDLRRFHWIGSPDKTLPMFFIRADSPYKSLDDILKSTKRPICGASSISDLTYSMSKVLELASGGSVKLILGYPGGKHIDAAMEIGEVVCRVASLDVYFGREPLRTWGKKGFLRRLLLFGHARDPRAPDVPTIYELMKQKRTPRLNRQAAEVILAGNQIGRPMVAPPGIPPEALKILREAYLKVFSDPDFRSELSRLRIFADPSPGAELEGLVEQLMDQPYDVIARLKTLFAT